MKSHGSQSERLAVLSQAEQEALYGLPDKTMCRGVRSCSAASMRWNSAFLEPAGPFEKVEGSYYYCAESVLLPDYRGQGAGHRFFDLREQQARALGDSHAAFCAVARPEDHPARPPKYAPLDPFWRKRGYAPVPGLVTEFSWRDLDQPHDTLKPMQFWMRDL